MGKTDGYNSAPMTQGGAELQRYLQPGTEAPLSCYPSFPVCVCMFGGTYNVQGEVGTNSSPELTWAGLFLLGPRGSPRYVHGRPGCCGSAVLGGHGARMSRHIPGTSG